MKSRMEKDASHRELKCITWSDLVLDIAIRQQAVVPTGVCITVFPDSTSNWSLNFYYYIILGGWPNIVSFVVIYKL